MTQYTTQFIPFTVGQRRKLKILSREQKELLEQAYQENISPTTETRDELAKKADMSARRVQTWFRNRRARERKKSRTLSPSIDTANCGMAQTEVDFFRSAPPMLQGRRAPAPCPPLSQLYTRGRSSSFSSPINKYPSSPTSPNLSVREAPIQLPSIQVILQQQQQDPNRAPGAPVLSPNFPPTGERRYVPFLLPPIRAKPSAN